MSKNCYSCIYWKISKEEFYNYGICNKDNKNLLIFFDPQIIGKHNKNFCENYINKIEIVLENNFDYLIL